MDGGNEKHYNRLLALKYGDLSGITFIIYSRVRRRFALFHASELPGGELPSGELPGSELPGGELPKQVAS
ncbi:hypothetical protein Tco_1430721 [Tanacetum coccineum]